MRITATKCKARELKPGDLFSTVGQYYWDHRDLFAIGASVYIRTEAPADPNADVYRIAIEPGVPQGGTIEVVPPQRTEGIPSAEAFGQGGSITPARREEHGTDND